MGNRLHDTVYERTDEGRVAVLKSDSGLSRQEQRLLLMMTGYTPLADLLALLDEDVPLDAVTGAVAALLQRQFIRPVEALPHGARVKWFGRPGAAAHPPA